MRPAEAFAEQLHALLPPGRLWPGPGGGTAVAEEVDAPEGIDYGTLEAPTGIARDYGTLEAPAGEAIDLGALAAEARELGVMQRLLLAFGAELARVDCRLDDLVRESYPGTAVELLDDWERELGLPGECGTPPTELAARQAAAAAKFSQRGGQSRAFFIDLAAMLGFPISIFEHEPYDCNSACDAPVNGELWRFVWDVQQPATPVVPMDCNSPCNASLLEYGNPDVECAIRPLAPAHTHVRFTYGTFDPGSLVALNFGTLAAPSGAPLDFGTLDEPTGPATDLGTI